MAGEVAAFFFVCDVETALSKRSLEVLSHLPVLVEVATLPRLPYDSTLVDIAG